MAENEYQVTKDIKLQVDRHGNVTLMQMNTLVNPEIAVSVVNLSATGATNLAEILGMVVAPRKVRQIA